MKRGLTIAIAGLCVLCLAAGAFAKTEIPSGHGDRYVHDRAGVISSTDEAAMESTHLDLAQKTGVALVVITVPQLEGETIEELARRVGETWKVGRKGEDRGIVVALSLTDRKLFISTGYGVEGYLPDGKVGRMREAVRPALSSGDFSSGLRQLSEMLVAESASEFGVTIEGVGRHAPQGYRQRERGNPVVRLIVAVVLIGGFILAGIRYPRLWQILFWIMIFSGRGGGFRGGGGFGGGGGISGFGGGGFGGGGAGGDF